MSGSTYDGLGDQELRRRLLEYGYNLPVSINRDFLLKKLQSVESKGTGAAAGLGKSNAKRRQTIATTTAVGDNNSPAASNANTRGRSKSKDPAPEANTSNTNGHGHGRTGPVTPTRKRASLNPEPRPRHSLPVSVPAAATTNRLPSSNTSNNKLPFSPRPGNTSTPVRKSIPAKLTNNDDRSSCSGTDDDDDVEDITQNYPRVPPRSLLTNTQPSSSPVRRAPVPLSRRSIHDPPQPATPNTERRLNGIDLSLFRGSGRGEGTYSTPMSMTTSSPTYRPRSSVLYTSKQYSDDEDTQDEDGDELPNRFKRFNLNLTSKLKTVAGYLNPFAYSSFFTRKQAGAMSSRAQNGQVTFRNGKSKSWLGPGTSATDTDTATPITPNSSHISTLIVAFFVIFFMIIGGSYYYMLLGGSGGTGGPPVKNAIQIHPPPPPVQSKRKTSFIPICGLDGVDQTVCINLDDAKPSKRLFDLLKTELAERKQWKGCGAEVKDKISLSTANTLLYRLSNFMKLDVDKCFRSMLILAVENPSWGLKIEKHDGDSSYEILKSTELLDLNYDSATISYGGNLTGITVMLCSFWSAVISIVQWLLTFGLVAGACYIGIRIGMKLWDVRQKEHREVFSLINEITRILQTQYEESSTSGADPFLAVNHIRDELFNPEERLTKQRVWEKAKDYISTHESRIREEIQHISGEEYRVWRWIPTTSPASLRKSLSPKHQSYSNSPSSSSTTSTSSSPAHLESVNPTNQNQWQGQAFDMNEGSPNAVPKSPTPCLKIRQMFNPNSDTPDQIRTKVEAAIRKKLANCNVIHVGIETRSQEGCVYIRCASKEDARNAYMELHGWWFDGKLLSVKFLREERYLERFPAGTN